MSLNIFNGFINMIRLRFEEEEETEFNAVEELIKLLDRFKETPKQKLVLSQIISYYIFVDLNLQKACEYTIKFYEIPGEQNCLEVIEFTLISVLPNYISNFNFVSHQRLDNLYVVDIILLYLSRRKLLNEITLQYTLKRGKNEIK